VAEVAVFCEADELRPSSFSLPCCTFDAIVSLFCDVPSINFPTRIESIDPARAEASAGEFCMRSASSQN
jgi:hypothetical protein